MPGYYYQPISRKQFLLTSGAMTTMLMSTRPTLGEAAAEEVRVALLSDTHIPADASNEYRGFRPVENLQQIVPQVVATNPQFAIINGDAARLTGEAADYQSLKRLLAPVAAKSPVHIGLGNHDHRGNFFGVFAQPEGSSPVAQKHVTVLETGGIRFVLLDSLLYVNKVAGLLGKQQRGWLEKFLAEADECPTVFFVHHTLGDGDGDLLDFDKVFRILRPHSQVKAVFYGHSHRYHVEQREHIYLINQPAVGYNFVDQQPVGWLDARFSTAGVELTLQAIGGNTAEHGKVTAIQWS